MAYNMPCYYPYCTTPWQWWPNVFMTTPRWNDNGGDGGGDQGIMYLWSPLAIFCVALGLLVALILIVLLAVMIYNYCTYGMCCCPGCAGQGPGCCCVGPMCCATQPEKTVVINRRRGSQDSRCSGGSVRGRKPRIVVDDGGSGCDGDNISIISRSNIDRKIVRIADAPEVHTIKVHRPASPMSSFPQQQPIILQPQIIVQPSTIQPATPNYPPPQQKPPPSFQGGELKVVIGNGYQQQRSASSKPMVFNMASNQPNEYVLTSVDNGGNNGGFTLGNSGGFNAGNNGVFNAGNSGGFSGGNNGGFNVVVNGGGLGAGNSGGCSTGNNGRFNIGMQSGNGNYGGDSNGCGYQDDRASSFSDGQRSAVIDIGHGVRSSFYPSLPRYDE